jgi:hypothetical protein
MTTQVSPLEELTNALLSKIHQLAIEAQKEVQLYAYKMEQAKKQAAETPPAE